MADQLPRTAGDFLGLFAYLAIMNGGWPDPELLSTGYLGGAGDPPEQRERPHLTIVHVPPEPVPSEEQEADIAAA